MWFRAGFVKSGFENLDFAFFNDKVSKLAFEPCGLDDVVVYPVVISTPGLSKNDVVVVEPMPAEPFYSNAPVFLRTGSEERNNMSLIIPFVEDF